MSAGQEIGSPIRENRTLLPAPLPPDEARGTSPPPRGCLRSGYALPSTPPRRHSHPDCRAVLTLIVAQQNGLIFGYHQTRPKRKAHLDLEPAAPHRCCNFSPVRAKSTIGALS